MTSRRGRGTGARKRSREVDRGLAAPGRWRRLNRERPWLKFAVLSAAVVLGLWLGVGCWQEIDETGAEASGGYAALAVVVPVPKRGQDLEGKKLVALTFDDGPSAATTGRLLDILAEKGVRATFFVLGSRAEQNPDLLRRQVAEHEVGSHTMGHVDMTKMSTEAVRADTEQMRGIIEAAGGKLELVRPPYGSVGVAAREGTGTPLMLWTVDPEDWRVRDAAMVRQRVVGAAFDGAVILMHDIYGSTVEAVGGIIDDLRAQGYEFLTVSELAEVRGVEMVNGVTYGSFRP